MSGGGPPTPTRNFWVYPQVLIYTTAFNLVDKIQLRLPAD